MRLVSILVIATAAVAAGARSFTAIGEWASDAPQRVLALLGARRDRQPTAVAVDGKTLRGTCQRDGTGGVHPLAAMTHHTGTVVAQTQVNDKTSEIAWFAPLLDRINDLTGIVITADTCTPSATMPATDRAGRGLRVHRQEEPTPFV